MSLITSAFELLKGSDVCRKFQRFKIHLSHFLYRKISPCSKKGLAYTRPGNAQHRSGIRTEMERYMSQWKPGETLHMDEGVYITANPPARSYLGAGGGGPGGGGAGFGNTPWGPYEGPHRGTGGGTIPRRQEATIHDIMGSEQTDLIKHLDAEYAPLRVDVPRQIDEAVSTAKAANNVPALSPREGISREYVIVSEMATEKQNQYLAKLPLAHQFFNNNPIYQLSHQYLSRMIEKNGLSSPEALRANFQEWESSYRAALDLNLVSESSRLLIRRLPEIAERQYQIEQGAPGDNSSQIHALERRLAAIKFEHRLVFQVLPAFLQAAVVAKTSSTPESHLTQALEADRHALAELAAQYQADIVPPAGKPNRSITPPLAKLELAGLKNLVDWQSAKTVGARWADYHASIYNSECARYLTECGSAIFELLGRAQRDSALLQNVVIAEAARVAAEQQAQEAARVAAEQQAQEAARVAADQQAQEAARVAAEQQAQEVARVAAEQQATEAEALLRNTYSYGAAAGVPTFAQAGGRQLLLSAASSTVLQGAIRTAVATLVAGTGAVLSVLGSPIVVAGVVVGVFVVAAAVIVGKNERSLSITTPLSDVMPIENLDIQGISAAGGVIELPYTLVTDRVGDKARVSVVKPDGHVVPSTAKVLAAKFDAAQNVFTVKMDSPSCTFTFTPMAPPGGDIPSSTTTPGELPVENPKYEGVSLEPVVIEAERLPSHQIEGTQSIILVFPKDSGLPPLLVVFSSPYGETDTTGEHSKRKYLARKAGGPVEKLDWRSAEIQIEGVELVRIHTARFGDTADNAVMIERLAAIAEGRLEVTDVDRRYYTHEIRELQRYRNLGVADGVDPKDDAIWNSAHAATLEDYQLSDDPSLLYTREAEEAALKQMEQEYGL